MATIEVISSTPTTDVVEVRFEDKVFVQEIKKGLTEVQLQAYADDYEAGHAAAALRDEQRLALQEQG